jgi:hypothetical protein
VQTVNRLHRLLTELIPGGAGKDLTATKAKRLLATVKPRSLVGKTTRRMAVEEVADLVATDAKLKALTKELAAAVRARGSHLMDLRGIGPAGAARILADVGDIVRFPDRNHFASWTGTAPLDASSGEHIRHRYSRAGNRRLNHVLHMAAIAQIRLPGEGRTYYRRKVAEAKTRKEARRCLKRRLSDMVYRQLVADAKVAEPGVSEAPPTESIGAGPGGYSGASLSHPARPTCTPRSSALRISHNPNPRHRRYPRDGPVRTPKRFPLPSPRDDAPEPSRWSAPRTNDLDGDKRRRTLRGAETALLTQRGTGMGHLGERAKCRMSVRIKAEPLGAFSR